MTPETLRRRLLQVAPPAADHCSLRWSHERTEVLTVRNDVVQPPALREDQGAMLTVVAGGGLGYAATSDLSESSLREAVRRALAWAEASASLGVTDFSAVPWPSSMGTYTSPVRRAWDGVPVGERLGLLRAEVASMVAEDVVERAASLMRVRLHSLLLTADGGEVQQHLDMLAPDARVVAHRDGLTQQRSFGLRGLCQQGGWEVLERVGAVGAGERLREEVLQLLGAPPCPDETTTLVLAPDQMMLQIHESIGHPLELDRILGDERNYAGTSFVRPEMIGTYRYGSPLLDVVFDPERSEQFATYGFDDEGAVAEKRHLIREGILVAALGGTLSQHRSGLPGVASARASSWNRPPMDRMANLNVEPGDTPWEQLIGQVERGVYMETNRSWSIDDSRNKFQFGCEWGRMVRDGQLAEVVRNPGYRGVSATFWRSLAAVGDASTLQVLGTPYCGKGEPNQVIRVGHASPACRFDHVAVFGS